MIKQDLKQTTNILWVDIAKFIAMFLVVFEHVILAFNFDNTNYIANVRNIIITFHMPLFFLISGYLYKQKSVKENYEKILWALLFPYLLYQFLYLPFKLGYYSLYENIPLSIASLKCFIGILLGDNLGITGSKYALTVCPACWFILVMIQLRFIFAHVNMNKKNLFLISLFSFVVLNYLQISKIDLYFCLDNTLYAIPYFSLGYFLKNYRKIDIDNIFYRIFYFVIALLLLFLVWGLEQKYSNILILNYICGLLGSFAIIFFAQIFKNTNKFLEIIAKNTLFLIFFQSLFLFITKWAKLYNISEFIQKIPEIFCFCIFYSIIIYIVSYFVIIFLDKINLNILLGKYKRRIG